MAKRITNSDLIGKAGVALVALRLSEMGFLFHETGSVEAGTVQRGSRLRQGAARGCSTFVGRTAARTDDPFPRRVTPLRVGSRTCRRVRAEARQLPWRRISTRLDVGERPRRPTPT
jgi:hypothetical protein